MTYQFGLIETYFIILSALLISVALLAWNRRPRIIARSTSISLATLAILTAGYALVLAAEGLEAKAAWYRLQVIGVCSIPTGWMLISLAYAGHARYLTRRNVVLLLVVPVVSLILAWTNDYHFLFIAPWVEVFVGRRSIIVADPHIGYLVLSSTPSG